MGDIGGGGSKPDVFSLIGVRAVLLPYSISVSLYEFFQWHYRFSYKGEDYGEAEQMYLTRRVLGIDKGRWDAMEEDRRLELLSKRLWEGDNAKAFFAAIQQEHQERMA